MTDRDPSDTFRRRLEGAIPELIRRAVELGLEKAQEAPEAVKQIVADHKLPREVAGYIFSQIDETKNGMLRVVAKEIRDFLDKTNVSRELEKVLTSVQFEINTTVRFRPNDGKRSGKASPPDPPGVPPAPESALASSVVQKPEVQTDVAVKRSERDRRDKGARDE
jgi:hypothetical protein